MNTLYALWPLITCWLLAFAALNFVHPERLGLFLFLVLVLIGGAFCQIWSNYVRLLEENKKSTKLLDIFFKN